MSRYITPAELGQVLRTIRGTRRQRAFAAEFGISQPDLSKAESGQLPDLAARIIEEHTGARFVRTVLYELQPAQ